MSKEGRQCPECQTVLSLVLLSDLVGGRKAGGLEVSLPAAGAVFDFFNSGFARNADGLCFTPTIERGLRPAAEKVRAAVAYSDFHD